MIKKIFSQTGVNLFFGLTLAGFVLFSFFLLKEFSSLKKEVASLSESIDKIDSNLAPASVVAGNDPKAIELFGFADLQKQLQSIKKQLDAVKKQGKNYTPTEQKEEENRMVSLAKDVNANVYKMASQFFETQLKGKNFEENEVKAIMQTYTKSFNEIQDVQIKWLNGEITWEDMPNELKPVYTNFYDNLRRDVGEKGASEAFNIFVPDPNMRRILLQQ